MSKIINLRRYVGDSKGFKVIYVNIEKIEELVKFEDSEEFTRIYYYDSNNNYLAADVCGTIYDEARWDSGRPRRAVA